MKRAGDVFKDPTDPQHSAAAASPASEFPVQLRLMKSGYNAKGQNVRGFIADAQMIAQFAVDEGQGLDFAATARVRDLLQAAQELCDGLLRS